MLGVALIPTVSFGATNRECDQISDNIEKLEQDLAKYNKETSEMMDDVKKQSAGLTLSQLNKRTFAISESRHPAKHSLDMDLNSKRSLYNKECTSVVLGASEEQATSTQDQIIALQKQVEALMAILIQLIALQSK